MNPTLRSALSTVPKALDRDAELGRPIRGEMAAELLAALKDIQENGPNCPTTGICDNIMYANFGRLFEFGYTPDKMLADMFSHWPEYSGNPSYPVPHPTLKPNEAYSITPKIWIGEYGMTRRRLLSFLIHELEKELA